MHVDGLWTWGLKCGYMWSSPSFGVQGMYDVGEGHPWSWGRITAAPSGGFIVLSLSLGVHSCREGS